MQHGHQDAGRGRRNPEDDRAGRDGEAHESGQNASGLCVLHLIQHRAGRYFVHRHPRRATSWRETCINEVVRKTNAVFTNLDLPQCDLRQEMSGEAVPAKRCDRCCRCSKTRSATGPIDMCFCPGAPKTKSCAGVLRRNLRGAGEGDQASESSWMPKEFS